MPKTRSGPSARTQTAAVTLLSIPPESPSTTPRRRRPRTCSSTATAILSAATRVSMRRTAGDKSTLMLMLLADPGSISELLGDRGAADRTVQERHEPFGRAALALAA